MCFGKLFLVRTLCDVCHKENASCQCSILDNYIFENVEGDWGGGGAVEQVSPSPRSATGVVERGEEGSQSPQSRLATLKHLAPG